MKQKDIKRLWEWCGFVFGVETNYEIYEDYKEHQIFYYPDSPITHNVYRLPEPTLDNLFQYAVPKFRHASLHYDKALGYLVAIDDDRAGSSAGNEDPTEALAQAILKVIDNE